MPASRRSTKTKALAVPGVVAVYHLGGRAAPAVQHGAARGSSRRSRRHLHARQCRPLRRPAHRRGGRRKARRPPRPACRALEVDYEILPAVFDPVAAMEPGAPMLHDKSDVVTDNGNIFCTLQGEIGDVAGGLQGSRRRPRDDLLDLARAARPSRDARLDRLARARTTAGTCAPARRARSPSSKKLAYLMGVPPAQIHVFTERVGGGFGGKQEMVSEDLPLFATHEARPAGEMGMDPRGGVHRRHDAAPDDDQGQDRRQEGRHADRARRACRVQYRRLRQPWQRDPGRGDGAARSRPIAAPTRRASATSSTPT